MTPSALFVLALLATLAVLLVYGSLSVGDTTRVLQARLAQSNSEWQARFDILAAQRLHLRRQLGALSCECRGIGFTGGFCLTKARPAVGGNELWSPALANELLFGLFNNHSLYDFGAGLGWYGKYFLAHGQLTDYAAFDGAENCAEVTNGFVQFLDLAETQRMPRKDWVLSLEVGEHIPREYETIFLDNLAAHNQLGIVLSWAVDKGGHFHVNERSNEYIKEQFALRGYTSDDVTASRLRRVAEQDWFKRTIMVFRRP